jgi:ribose 1,5-bisphosphokinase PhnN
MVACFLWLRPGGFKVLGPEVGPEATMKRLAGRKRHSVEDIVRKLRRADQLAAERKNRERMATGSCCSTKCRVHSEVSGELMPV